MEEGAWRGLPAGSWKMTLELAHPPGDQLEGGVWCESLVPATAKAEAHGALESRKSRSQSEKKKRSELKKLRQMTKNPQPVKQQRCKENAGIMFARPLSAATG